MDEKTKLVDTNPCTEVPLENELHPARLEPNRIHFLHICHVCQDMFVSMTELLAHREANPLHKPS